MRIGLLDVDHTVIRLRVRLFETAVYCPNY
nr:MAG TPA: hypothetical protein [Caudoviricetes sp.]